MEKPDYVKVTEEAMVRAHIKLDEAEAEHMIQVAITRVTAQAVSDAWAELDSVLEPATKAIDRWLEEEKILPT